jgi:hypothetical protein
VGALGIATTLNTRGKDGTINMEAREIGCEDGKGKDMGADPGKCTGGSYNG